MQRSHALLLCLALILGCGPPADEDVPAGSADELAEAAGSGASRPKRVVLVALDTVRADHLGIYGYDRLTTPVLDGLGRNGVVFEDVTSTAPWTLPATASLLTGLYPSHHGAHSNDWALAPEQSTLATVLAHRGYTTAAVVNVGFLSPIYGLSDGFEHFRYVTEAEDRVRPSTWVTERAIEWLDELRDERLFLFVHYYDAHSSYSARPAYERLFASDYDGAIDGSSDQLNSMRWGGVKCWEGTRIVECDDPPDVPEDTPSLDELSADDLQHLVDLYDANLRQLDTELGRIFAFLRVEGMLDDTLVVVTADHGEEFLEHGGVLHSRTQYEEVLSVPLIFRGPGVPAGERVSTPVSLVDVVPTVLSMLGEAEERELDGMDLSDLWSRAAEPGEAAFAERRLFAESTFSPLANDIIVAAREGRFKLIHNRVTGGDELYDLQADPGEHRNIAARKPEVVDRLLEAALALQEERVEGVQVDLSQREIERLRALGYLP